MAERAAILVGPSNWNEIPHTILDEEYRSRTGHPLAFIKVDEGRFFEYRKGVPPMLQPLRQLGKLAAVHYNGNIVDSRSPELCQALRDVPAINYALAEDNGTVRIMSALKNLPSDEGTKDKIRVFVADGVVVNALDVEKRRWVDSIPVLVRNHALFALHSLAGQMEMPNVNFAFHVDIVSGYDDARIRRLSLQPRRVNPFEGDARHKRQAIKMPRTEIDALLGLMN